MDDERDSATRRSKSIAHRGGAIRFELALLVLIVGTLAATCNLLLAIYRHAAITPRPPGSRATVALERPLPLSSAGTKSPFSLDKAVSAKPAIARQSPEPATVLAPPEDPTKKVLAGLTTATAREVEAAGQADRRVSALEAAREASEAESRRWKRREMLVHQQIAGLTVRADQLESAASLLDAERDVLAKERDALKAALAKAGRRSGFAVLPYKGPNGTWRRPIVLECTSGGVKLQPKGLTFTSMDLSPLINPRLSPLVRAVAHEMLHIRGSDTPDGAAAVPYLVFLVRPSGIRPYYEARSCLEPLGIAFGYELIEQDLAVDIPDFDNLATWDGSVPLDLPVEPAPRPKVSVAMNSPTEPGNGASTGPRSDRPAPTGWPESSGRGGQQPPGNPGTAGSATPEDFVWPSGGRRNAASNGRVSLPGGSGGSGGQGDGGGGGLIAPGSGTGQNDPSAGDGSREPFSGQTSSSGGALRDGNAPGSPRSGLYPSGRTGSSLSRGGGAGSNLLPGGGSGSSVSPGGGTGSSFASAGGMGSSAPPGGGTGSRVSPGGGLGSSPTPGGGLGSSPTPGGGLGSSFASGGGAGSRSTLGSAGGSSLSASGAPPGALGSGPGLAANGGMNALPDLEQAGDGGSLPPLPPLPAGLTAGGSGAEGPYQNPVAGEAGAGVTSAGGPSSTSSGPGGGPSQGPAAGLVGQAMPSTVGSSLSDSGPAGAGGASPGVGPGAAGGGTAANNTNSSSTGSDPATQPYRGQPAGSAGGSQGPNRSSSSPGTSSSASAGGQPPVGMNLPDGLTSPSSGSSPGFGMPSGPSSSSPASGSSSSLGMPSDSSSSASGSSSGPGMPSSSSSSSPASSSSSMGGMPLDSSSTGGSSSSSSSLSFGPGGGAGSESSSSDDLIFPPAPKPAPRPGSIEVPYEIVVVCRRDDLLLHPGGYRLTTQLLERQGPSKDGTLAREIVAMVRKRAIVDPLIRPKPKIKFLVETDGAGTFWTARRQLMFALPDWPMSLQVSGPQGSHVFTKETW